jgi:Na+/proline symporter
METSESATIASYEKEYSALYAGKRVEVDKLVDGIQRQDTKATESASEKIKFFQEKENVLKDSVKSSIARAIPGAKIQDRDYIFLNFVLSNLPHGIVGLLLAVMFSAAMSSMAGELSALASTATVDIYKRSIRRNLDDRSYVLAFAENLIQFVNIVGSLFYGTILGIFLAAFYIKHISGTAVFWAAILAEAIVLYCFNFTSIAYLLYNIIGCAAVIFFALVFQLFLPAKPHINPNAIS